MTFKQLTLTAIYYDPNVIKKFIDLKYLKKVDGKNPISEKQKVMIFE